MPFPGMLRRVALVKFDVSEECSASMIRVTGIGGQGRGLAVTSHQRTLRSSPILVNLMLEGRRSSETSVLTRATRPNIPRDGNFQQIDKFSCLLNLFIFQ
jgi:hypothetical protein